MILIIVFSVLASLICTNQLIRFFNEHFLSMETDYRNWTYEPMAITICTNYFHENATEEVIQRFEGEWDADSYEDYHQFFRILSVLNVENMHLMEEITNIDRFVNLTGEDLFNIVVEVNKLLFFIKMLIIVSLIDVIVFFNSSDETSRFMGSFVPCCCYRSRNLLFNIKSV